MAVQSENVEQLMKWLTDSSDAGADSLVARLAALVFQGDAGWPGRTDRVEAYRDELSSWFAQDGAGETRFADLARPDADPGILIDWLLSVVGNWEERSASGAAGGADSVGYEANRYSETAHDDSYGLDYRLDRSLQVYEWYDESTGTWQDQTWADLYAAGRNDPAATARMAEGDAQPEWDESWAMFYRVGPGGVYEFADAVTPGDQSSGCGTEWLGQEQVLTRRGGRQEVSAASAPRTETAPEVAQLQREIRASVISALKKDRPRLEASFTEKDIDTIVANLTKKALGS